MPNVENSRFASAERHSAPESRRVSGGDLGTSVFNTILDRLDQIEVQLAYLVARQPASFGDTDRRQKK